MPAHGMSGLSLCTAMAMERCKVRSYFSILQQPLERTVRIRASLGSGDYFYRQDRVPARTLCFKYGIGSLEGRIWHKFLAQIQLTRIALGMPKECALTSSELVKTRMTSDKRLGDSSRVQKECSSMREIIAMAFHQGSVLTGALEWFGRTSRYF